jgi:hypothetical protein
MAGRFRARFSLPEQDLRRLADCIVEHARPGEERDVERLLGALTTLAASGHPMPGATIAFSPPPGTASLVERALAAMRRSDRHDARARRTRSAA